MRRYFFHLHECGAVLEDREGQACASLQDANRLAIENARDVMVGELRAGRLCLDCFIAITDASGAELARLPFRDAVVVAVK